MKNKKVIILCGFAHGGTNILWNIIQSHPLICTPIYETGEIFRRSQLLKLLANFPSLLFSRTIIDRKLFALKMETLNHPDNRYKTEQELYKAEEVKNSIICLKSVNIDIYLTEVLVKTYPELYFIGLARDGYALCDGYLRRGHTISEVTSLYLDISRQMRNLSHKVKSFKLIKLEDALERPFQVAEEIFDFLNVTFSPEKLRLKSKKIISLDGSHATQFGEENKKYWFSRAEISKVLNTDIDSCQKQRVSEDLLLEFQLKAASALDFFGYTKEISDA